MKKLPFSKYQWTWNDFILIDQFNWNLSGIDFFSEKELIQKMCDRNFWIWADWVVIIRNWKNEKFYYQMFNPDWSIAEMCWNWIRCYLKFLIKKWYCNHLDEIKVETLNWTLKVKMDWELIVVDMWAPTLKAENIPAPQLAIQYYKLGSDAKLTDLIKCVRADEQHHSETNHNYADNL